MFSIVHPLWRRFDQRCAKRCFRLTWVTTRFLNASVSSPYHYLASTASVRGSKNNKKLLLMFPKQKNHENNPRDN